MRTARGIATAVFVAVAVAATGCSDKNALTGPPPSTPAPTSAASSFSPTPTPSTSPTPRPTKTSSAVSDPNAKFANDPAVQAFFEQIKARTEALNRRNLRYAPLRRVSTSARLREEAKTLAMMKRADLVIRGAGYLVVQDARRVGSDRVAIRVCEDDDEARFVSVKTGKTAIPVRNRWLTYEVQMVRRGGQWKVHRSVLAKFTCKGKLRS